MKVLYVSSVCSKKTISTIFSNSEVKIAQSMQKFSHLLLDGFVREGAKVTCLSTMFVQRSLMFMLPFQGVIAVSLYKENFNNRFFISVYTVITTISIILFFGYLYSYRGNEMF